MVGMNAGAVGMRDMSSIGRTLLYPSYWTDRGSFVATEDVARNLIASGAEQGAGILALVLGMLRIGWVNIFVQQRSQEEAYPAPQGQCECLGGRVGDCRGSGP